MLWLASRAPLEWRAMLHPSSLARRFALLAPLVFAGCAPSAPPRAAIAIPPAAEKSGAIAATSTYEARRMGSFVVRVGSDAREHPEELREALALLEAQLVVV